MRRSVPVLLVLGSTLTALLLFEGVARLMVRPSAVAWGTLGGRELPPLRIVPQPASPDFNPDLPVPEQAADGERLTQGDLYGVFREDPEIGYTWAPSRVSRHGWWRANALGARADAETAVAVPAGKRRMLVFGDSFAALVAAPAGDLDHGADGTHYGPRASAQLANALARALPGQRLTRLLVSGAD